MWSLIRRWTKKLREGQEIVFIFNGTLMKGILWEKGLLDYAVKSPNVTGIAYIRHEQVVRNGAMRDAVQFLNKGLWITTNNEKIDL